MSLLFPLGLIGLLALPIIVLLHLLRERRRRVAVPSLLLWQNLPRRPDGQRSSVLPVTLLLLLHLLVAALVTLALARPQWLGQLLGGGQQLVIVIDSSTSMGAQDGSATRLQSAQSRARSLITGMGANDSAAVISMGPQSRLLARGTVESQQQLLAALEQVHAGGSGVDLQGALTLAEALHEPNRNGRIILLSDAALTVTPDPQQQVSMPVSWERVGDAEPNRAIVTFAAQSRSGGTSPVQVYARVVNYSEQSAQAWVRLYGDDAQIDERFVELTPEGQAELTWSVPPGPAVLRAQLESDDGLAADNTALLSLAQVRPLRVLLVSEAANQQTNTNQGATSEQADLLRRALAALPGLSIASVSPADYASSSLAARADLTVFEGFLPEQWPAGGVLVIAPPLGNGLLSVGESRVSNTNELHTSSSLLEGLSLDSVRFGPIHVIETPEWADVLLSNGDMPLILRGRTDTSEVAIWNFALRESNLPSRLAFPLLLARTVRDLTPQPLPASLEAGATLQLRPSPRATQVELTAPDGSVVQRDAAALLRFDALDQPGMYSVSEKDAGGAVLYNGQVAVNAGTAGESDLRPQPEPNVAVAPTSPTDDPEQQGRDLWPWFSLIALLVIVGEWMYVHR